jgi:superoxide dismutase, Fe-Mn family
MAAARQYVGRMTRRDAIKVMGGGAALVSLGGLSRLRAADAVLPAGAGATKQPFVLPKIEYGFDALEPYIDALTMEIHFSKHHAAYIKNANKALEGHPALGVMTAEEILVNLPSIEEPLRTTLRNNVGGHVNHSFWWSILSPKGTGEPSGALADALTQTYSSFDSFKARFKAASLTRFGSGWQWLAMMKDGRLIIHSTANQDSPLSEGSTPIVGIDVWEHAYYLKHQNLRADYVDAFWNVLNWEQAGRNYAAAKAAVHA